MTIWAFNEPGNVDFVSKSVVEGTSRFGWSYFDTADLNVLKDKSWEEMNEDEQICWKQSWFMLDIQKDDWIVHINVPEWGKCTTAKVISGYSFENEGNEVGDFRHMIEIDKESVIIFDRNDDNILPIVSRKLKLRGRYWRIYCEAEFFLSIKNLETAEVNLEGLTRGVYYLKKELSEPLKNITNLIHKNHPGKELEKFIAEILRRMPNVNDDHKNGFS